MLEIMPLGAGSEVGRSCVLAKYKNKSVMFDCGVHPGYSGIASLPYFDEVDLSTIDAMLVTHFHLDHCAAVPFVVGHTNFRGRIFMTHPTKAIFAMLMSDFVKLNKGADSEALFTDKEFEVVASAPIDRQGKKATGRKTNRDAMRRRFELDEEASAKQRKKKPRSDGAAKARPAVAAKAPAAAAE